MSRILHGKVPKTKFLDEEKAIEVELISFPDKKLTEKMIVNTCYGHSNPEIYDTLKDFERKEAINEVLSNKTLPKALEMTGKFVFLIKNISLTITHCICRHRFFTILQSSTAVDDLRNVNFVMPKSFARNEKFYEKIKNWYLQGKELFCEGVDEHGLSVQNARLLIPKNNLNHMFIGMDLKSFSEAYSQRVCVSEEPVQNNIIFKKMKDLILEKFPYFKDYFKSHCETGRCLHTKAGKHSNIVFKRDELHKKFLPKDYSPDIRDNLLHDKTRDGMNKGPDIVEEKYEGYDKK